MVNNEPAASAEAPAAPADALAGLPAAAPEQIDAEVDARGMACPLPILKAKKALATLTSGQILRVLATDTGSRRDFEAFARQTGNVLVHQSADNGLFTFHLRRR